MADWPERKKMIKVKSAFLKDEIEVNGCAIRANGQDVVIMSHPDFEALYLEYEETLELAREYHDLTDLYKYPAIRCVIKSGKKRRTGNKIGSANPKSLETAVSRAFPAEVAEKRAFDRAVKEFFALESKVYSEDEVINKNMEAVTSAEVEESFVSPADYSKNAEAQPARQEAVEEVKNEGGAFIADEDDVNGTTEQQIVEATNLEQQIAEAMNAPVDDVMLPFENKATSASEEIEAPVIPEAPEQEISGCADVQVTFGQYFMQGKKLSVKETFEYDRQQIESGAQKKSLVDFFLTKARPDPEKNPERAEQLEAIKQYAREIGYTPKS